MTKLAVGEKVDVRHKDQISYIFRVQVTAIPLPNEFIGRVDEIFADPRDGSGSGAICPDADIHKWIGKQMSFSTDAIVR